MTICWGTLTNVPLVKYIPSPMDAAEPVAVESEEMVRAKGVPDVIAPTVSDADSSSLSWNGFI